MEFQERVSFLRLLVEKQLRCESEFRLAQLSDGVLTRTRVTADVPSESHVGTLGTGPFFDKLDCPSSLEHGLEHIAEIGRREHWLVAEEDLRLLPQKILGSGSFGVVVAARLHGTAVVVKLQRRAATGDNIRYLVQIGNELRILRHVRHPNIVPRK